MLLVIDNYDSFVHNLARYLRQLGHETRVIRNDAISRQQVIDLAPSAIVLSPGPGTPQEAGQSLKLVSQMAGQIPLLGVCLGHQTLAAAFGADIVRASEPVHGRSSAVIHGGGSVFAGLPSPIQVGRYHSLIVAADSLPPCLRPTAHLADGTVMAFEHDRWPIVGLQFHPESVLTEYGYELLANFLRLAGLVVRSFRPPDLYAVRPPSTPLNPWPRQPITF